MTILARKVLIVAVPATVVMAVAVLIVLANLCPCSDTKEGVKFAVADAKLNVSTVKHVRSVYVQELPEITISYPLPFRVGDVYVYEEEFTECSDPGCKRHYRTIKYIILDNVFERGGREFYVILAQALDFIERVTGRVDNYHNVTSLAYLDERGHCYGKWINITTRGYRTFIKIIRELNVTDDVGCTQTGFFAYWMLTELSRGKRLRLYEKGYSEHTMNVYEIELVVESHGLKLLDGKEVIHVTVYCLKGCNDMTWHYWIDKEKRVVVRGETYLGGKLMSIKVLREAYTTR